MPNVMTISELQEKLEALKQEHGDLPVYYVSDYDWVMPLRFCRKEEDRGWDNEPGKEPYIGLC